MDETYVKVAGMWRYVYRAVDHHGQVIDVYVSKRRNVTAAARFFETLLTGRERPREVATDLAAPLLRVVDQLGVPALHDRLRVAAATTNSPTTPRRSRPTPTEPAARSRRT